MLIYQLKDGYRYNSDTIMLYDFALSLKPKGEILEVGAGSGVLGLLLKRDLKDINLTLMDIQEQNIILCKKNALENGLECKILHADFSNFKSSKRFDFIVSNPPFYHDGVIKSKNSHINISRYASNLSLEILISNSNSHLKPHGSIIFCYDAKQIMDVIYVLRKNKFCLTKLKFIHPKSKKSAKIALIEAKKSSKSLCEVLESFYLNDDFGYTKEADLIFKNLNLKSQNV
ncbi:methyltransferase [Campylobacter sp. FMV-PI01]|uniref:Methyltransferase n=1 Tax=Campylobacter portucalensis TaxID=2608384 RepID=A0A6L5WMX3_9BACT|nr:methyltransferase [Campylobacter portucalensis]MSN97011.1 methyltransferase [Campylobacter portucalensis]